MSAKMATTMTALVTSDGSMPLRRASERLTRIITTVASTKPMP